MLHGFERVMYGTFKAVCVHGHVVLVLRFPAVVVFLAAVFVVLVFVIGLDVFAVGASSGARFKLGFMDDLAMVSPYLVCISSSKLNSRGGFSFGICP